MHNFIKPENWYNLPLYEKVKIYGSTLTEEYSKYVDKIEVKKYIDSINSFYKTDIKYPKIIKILKDTNDFYINYINENHIIKSSHGSGWNIDMEYIKHVLIIQFYLNYWNKEYKIDGLNEPQYKYIKPRFFIEEKIQDKYSNKINGFAIVYMIRCLNGKPFLIHVKNYEKYSSLYDIDWNILDYNELNISKPKNIDKMLYYASILSKPFEFVRVDFYIDYNDNIYFSELSFTPSGGKQVFSDKLEIEYGKLWN